MPEHNTLPRKEILWQACALACLGLLAYSNTFNAEFHLDDYPNILENSLLSGRYGLAALWRFFPSRFAAFLTFFLNARLESLWGFHAANILIHIAAACSALLLVRLLYKTPAGLEAPEKEHVTAISFFCSLIFLLHPVQTEAVTYIYQRVTSLAALLYIIAVVFYLKYRISGGITAYCAACLAGFLAMFSKETALTLPLALAAVEYLLFRENSLKQIKLLPFVCMWIPALYAITHSETFVDINKLAYPGEMTPLKYLASQPRVLLTYLRLFLLPVNQMLLYDLPVAANAVWTLSLVFVTAAVTYLARKNTLAVFGILWAAITLSVESSVIPLQDIIFEHRMYLPMPGLTLAAVTVLFRLAPAKRAVFAACCWAAVLATAAFSRNQVWRTEASLWSDNMAKAPRLAAPCNNLAVALMKRGDYQKSEALLKQAVSNNPNFAQAYNNLGYILYRTGRVKEAADALLKAAALNTDADRAYQNLGNLWTAEGNSKKAAFYYQNSLNLNPGNSGAAFGLGKLYLADKEYPRALYFLGLAAKLQPDNAQYREYLERAANAGPAGRTR